MQEHIDQRAIELGKVIHDIMLQVYDMVDASLVSFHSDEFRWYIPEQCISYVYAYVTSISHSKSWTDVALSFSTFKINEVHVLPGYEYKVILASVHYPFTQSKGQYAELQIP